MKMKMTMKVLSVFLVLVMLLGLMPTSAFAKNETGDLPVCTCETACTAENMNPECPVCGAEGALPESCGQIVSETAVTLTLILSDGLSADGMEAVDEFTYKLSRTADEDGRIDPIEISCGDAGAFSADLAEEMNKNSSISDNSLNVAYNSDNDTLTVSGSPSANVELDLSAILATAMETMGAYDAAPAEADEHTHCICGSTGCTDSSHSKSLTWQPWANTDSLPVNAGNYYLTQDVTLSATWTCNANVNLCLNGKNITCSATDGSPIFDINAGASLVITDCQNCGAITYYGYCGVKVETNATFILWNGNINALTSDKGGIDNYGIFTMNGGSITSNWYGVSNYNSFTLNGGSITSRTSGVVQYASTFTMNGGSITSTNGTGVYVNVTRFSASTTTMNGGSITNCGKYGVYTYRDFTMNGGSITNCAIYGVYIYNTYTANFTMNGGSITSNSAGVYHDGNAFSVSGAATINGNTQNVHLASGKTIAINGSLQNGASIGITAENPDSSPTVVTGTTDTTSFFSDDHNYGLATNDSGDGLKLVQEHTHCICGNTGCTDSSHSKNLTWQPWANTDSLPVNEGNYYLTQDVTLNATWECHDNVNLCLNGKPSPERTGRM